MRHRTQQNHAMLMTEGPIARQLIAFAFPLLLGNLFQQLYNTADSLIVGNFLGSEALAAVSSSSNVIHLLIGFFNGLAMGAGVVISRHYGARHIDRVQKAIHTMLAGGLAVGVFLTAAGVAITPVVLRLMDTPESVLPQSISYFRTYFLGSMAFVLYNVCTGILQAVGDSRHPLYYLIVSSIVNVALDLLFVAVLGFGVASAAAATAISQFVAFVLCLRRLMHSDPEYRVDLKKLCFDRPSLRAILQNGVPSGFANCIISFANVVVQASINGFGAAAMAGCGAHSRIEGFAFLPVTCFNMALTTFVGQNLGANRHDRVRKGIRIGAAFSAGISEAIAVLLYFFSPQLIGLFVSDPEAIAYGVMHERTIVLFFFLATYTHAIAAALRGAGKSTVAMAGMAICWCAIRVPYVTIAVRLRPILTSVSWAYPITWVLSSVFFTVYYLKGSWGRKETAARL